MKDGDRKQIGNVIFEAKDEKIWMYSVSDERSFENKKKYLVIHANGKFYVFSSRRQVPKYDSYEDLASAYKDSMEANIDGFDALPDAE